MTNPHPDMDTHFREMMRHLDPADVSAIELFRNLARTYHILENLLEKRIAKYNLSIAKMRILWWLKMRDIESTEGGGLLPSELSRFQGVTPNTMSSLLNSLRESGLIKQIDHPEDRRKHVIKITRAGRDLLQEVNPEYNRYLRELLADLSEEERQTMIGLLRRIVFSARSMAGCEPSPTEKT